MSRKFMNLVVRSNMRSVLVDDHEVDRNLFEHGPLEIMGSVCRVFDEKDLEMQMKTKFCKKMLSDVQLKRIFIDNETIY